MHSEKSASIAIAIAIALAIGRACTRVFTAPLVPRCVIITGWETVRCCNNCACAFGPHIDIRAGSAQDDTGAGVGSLGGSEGAREQGAAVWGVWGSEGAASVYSHTRAHFTRAQKQRSAERRSRATSQLAEGARKTVSFAPILC